MGSVWVQKVFQSTINSFEIKRMRRSLRRASPDLLKKSCTLSVILQSRYENCPDLLSTHPQRCRCLIPDVLPALVMSVPAVVLSAFCCRHILLLTEGLRKWRPELPELLQLLLDISHLEDKTAVNAAHRADVQMYSTMKTMN